jgi:hypothetical protein
MSFRKPSGLASYGQAEFVASSRIMVALFAKAALREKLPPADRALAALSCNG